MCGRTGQRVPACPGGHAGPCYRPCGPIRAPPASTARMTRTRTWSARCRSPRSGPRHRSLRSGADPASGKRHKPSYLYEIKAVRPAGRPNVRHPEPIGTSITGITASSTARRTVRARPGRVAATSPVRSCRPVRPPPRPGRAPRPPRCGSQPHAGLRAVAGQELLCPGLPGRARPDPEPWHSLSVEHVQHHQIDSGPGELLHRTGHRRGRLRRPVQRQEHPADLRAPAPRRGRHQDHRRADRCVTRRQIGRDCSSLASTASTMRGYAVRPAPEPRPAPRSGPRQADPPHLGVRDLGERRRRVDHRGLGHTVT